MSSEPAPTRSPWWLAIRVFDEPAGVVGLQLIVAASMTSAVELNETARAWLAMSDVWTSATDLKRAMPMGSVGQLLIHGWQI